MTTRSPFLAAAVAAALAVGASPAFAQSVSEVAVRGPAPTQLTISLAGKSATDVRREVRTAAGTVCRNAISNRELAFDALLPCKQAAQGKALRRYAAIVSARAKTTTTAMLVLSSR